MKRTHILLLASLLLIAAGAVLGQDTGQPSFGFVQQLGRIRPQGIIYNQPFDQFAWVDERGRFLLVDATTYQTQVILHENETYSAYTFSHDGRWLALGIGRRVELWDTQTWQLLTSIEPDGTRGIASPLIFSDDDRLLLINAIVPAPQELRRSENDTSNLPWLWDVRAAQRLAPSILPRRAEAIPFFEYRNGFVLGPNNKVIAARPQRLEIIDIDAPGLPVITEIETQRNEQDPISVWFSLRDEMIYARPINQSNLIQIDTNDGSPFDIPVGRELNYRALQNIDGLVLSRQSRIIGQANTRDSSSLLRLLLGDDYQAMWNYHPLTVILVDILQPITLTPDEIGFLLYILDEQTGTGTFDFVRPVDVRSIALHPDDTRLMVRRASGSQPIEVYNIATGLLEQSYFPALPDFDGNHVLAYNKTGDVVLNHFQRFDAASGEVLYENLDYIPRVEQFFFTQDSRHIITINGTDWWQWDIATGEVIRRAQVRLRGSLIQTSPDGIRFLTALDTPAGPGREIVEVGKDERLTVIFDRPANGEIYDVIHSPNWENYIVFYYIEDAPAVGLYNIHDGLRWFVSGGDLPPVYDPFMGWLDNETMYIYGTAMNTANAPETIYGLDYHPSGLPACLVEAFPNDEWTQWRDLWERLIYYMSPDAMWRFTQRICDALPASADEIDAVFNPTPTPTRPPVTPRPSIIVGVPECLTLRFPTEAVEYGRSWREITAGLSREEITELEQLLCDGLTGAPSQEFIEGDSGQVAVMTININTGVRATGSFIPPSPAPAQIRRSVQLVLDEFERTERVRPGDSILSPDGTLLAARTIGGHVMIFRLLKPYETIAAEATATAQILTAADDDAPRRIAVRPTATQAFDTLGQPRPTLTPTVTPTSPPPADQTIEQPAYGEIEEVCDLNQLYNLRNPAPGYAAAGRLLTTVANSRVAWVVDLATRRFYPDENIPPCNLGVNCNFSFDQNRIIYIASDIRVSRPDGSDTWVLFNTVERPVWPAEPYWVDNDTLEYSYNGYMPDRSVAPLTLYQRAYPADRTLSEPALPPEPISINQLPTNVIALQPHGGILAVVHVGYNDGSSRYYIYDRETGTAEYFTRLTGFTNLTVQWHPLGKALYYRYPTQPDWYIFDPETREHRILGDLPDGRWSRNGRYRVSEYRLPQEEIEVRQLNNQPIPNVRVWDSETGLIRLYCIPEIDPLAVLFGTDDDNAEDLPAPTPTLSPDQTVPEGVTFAESARQFHWSPDNRYLAILITGFGSGGEVETSYSTILVLDAATGSFTQIRADAESIITWTTPEGVR